MLARIGVADDRRPVRRRARGQARCASLVDLPRRQGEIEVERALGRAGGEERRRPARCRSSSAPAPTGTTCRRRVDHLIQRSEFLTSYTPYQPEIAQGTLQYLFEFQTQVALLTGMEVANASMYDGSTAAAEAVLMAHRVTRRSKAVLSGGLHPHYRETIETVSRMAGHEIVRARRRTAAREDLVDAIDDRRLLRRRAEPRRLRPARATSTPIAEAATPPARC